jgi:phospholipid/cholesterol/gamma-HCH transport system permease protein
MQQFYETQRNGAQLALRLAGRWCATEVGAIEPQLAGLDTRGLQRILVSTRDLADLDISGAWLLWRFARDVRAAGTELGFVDGEPEQLGLIDRSLADAGALPPLTSAPHHEVFPGEDTFAAVGRRAVRAWHALVTGLGFVGQVSMMLGRAMLTPRRWRPTSIARHVYDTGVTAIPIVALIAFLIAVIVAYMGAQQLRKFGADIFVVDLVTVGILREMGVLLTAIIVAGRSGSSYAAEIGAMKLNEEVDALHATGVDPIEVLVLPRMLGLMIALPLLTVVADAVGLAGGALLCRFLLDMPFVQYIERTDEAIASFTFWAGIIKAPVFAILIATAGAFRGLQVRSSSRELGRLTTVAVVQAIFLVILFDALFAVLFMELDI